MTPKRTSARMKLNKIQQTDWMVGCEKWTNLHQWWAVSTICQFDLNIRISFILGCFIFRKSWLMVHYRILYIIYICLNVVITGSYLLLLVIIIVIIIIGIDCCLWFWSLSLSWPLSDEPQLERFYFRGGCKLLASSLFAGTWCVARWGASKAIDL